MDSHQGSKRIRLNHNEVDKGGNDTGESNAAATVGGGDDLMVASWTDLPETAIRLITIAAGASGLNFCAACKTFRAAQPPLRVLMVNFEDKKSYVMDADDKEKLKDEFCVVLCDDEEPKHAHKIIESLPDRYANEITHLFLRAVHLYDYGTEGPAALLNGPLDDYGKKLISLRFLHLHQPAAGHTSADEPPIQLRDCALQLVRVTKPTLRNLIVRALIRFDVNDAVRMFEEVGLEELHHLQLYLIPWSPWFQVPRGNVADTKRLKLLSQEKCTALKGDAVILCHA